MGSLPAEGAVSVQAAALKKIFRPSSPVDDHELFRGRIPELLRVIGAVEELGQHAVIFGERGIGKTSLAYLARDAFRRAAPSASLAVRISCSADDDFASVWNKFIPRMQAELDPLPLEVRNAVEPLVERAKDILELDSEVVSPDTIARAISVVCSRMPLLIVLDEFDRIEDWESTELFVDLIKVLSDDLVPCTLLIVGVADHIDGLISGHRSVERSLKQIAMPRMSAPEIREIVIGGFDTLKQRVGLALTLDDDAVDHLVRLSQGFPHYAHLLAGSIGEVAILTGHRHVTSAFLSTALSQAMENSQQSIIVAYDEAVSSSKKNARFGRTLLACTLADVDELGFFAPADVAKQLSLITGARKSAADFTYHLKRFSDAPSYILETRGEGRSTRYRFSNPLMRPFVLMKAFKDDTLQLDSHGGGFTYAKSSTSDA